MKSVESTIKSLFTESITTKQAALQDAAFMSGVADSAKLLRQTVDRGGTIYTCGNGGSTCDGMHLCEELVARYKRNRPGIRAMHFSDASTITCWSNDYSFDDVFARYAETFCTRKDILIAISTSGNSKNVLNAVRVAKRKGTAVVGLTGKDGGKLKNVADVAIVVPSSETERIQEVHITVVHVWCELLEMAAK